jgi:ABC-type glycerol-3-phosphate transport system permease component
MLVYHAAVGGLGFVMLYPILWLFASSFKGPSEIWTDVMSLIPRQLNLQNYVTGWQGFGGITSTPGWGRSRRCFRRRWWPTGSPASVSRAATSGSPACC